MLTVMFSSHNGAAVLPQTLDSMVRALPPAGGWKLVTVDNASTDTSAALLESYKDRLPLTLLHEPQPGKNRALNRALAHAEGDLFIFCDDDVVVEPDWLVQWRALADSRPDYALFAGSTRPLWPFEPADWIKNDVEASIVFATNEYMREGPCPPIAMFGTNMAIRASVFADGLRFNENIGPDGSGAYAMGSETELATRLAAMGHRCLFSNAPMVRHIIRAKQMERVWILLRAYRWGRGQAHMKIAHTYPPPRLKRKNLLRWALYRFLMPFYSYKEAWARQWEWMIDQGHEDGWRESHGRGPRWKRGSKGPLIAARFRRAN